MKVIDLLNKIANGEEVPKKIKYRNKIFIYDKDNQCYVVENYNEYYDLHMSLSNHKGTDLHYEVEIIEEPQEHKIPEKLNTWYSIEPVKLDSPTTFKDNSKYIDFNTEMFFDKINEIIDYLEKQNDNNSD